MDFLNNLINRVSSSLGFGGDSNQTTNQAPKSNNLAQSTASGQGSVNMDLMPQSLAQMPQNVQKAGPDLSPRAFSAEQIVNNLDQYLASGPTENYDFLGSLPSVQTPQGVFNQQTQQVENRQGQQIGIPNQTIQQITPQIQLPQIDQSFVPQAAPITTIPIEAVTTENTSTTPTFQIPEPTTEMRSPEPTEIVVASETPNMSQATATDNQSEKDNGGTIVGDILQTGWELIRGVAGIVVNATTESPEYIAFRSLDDATKALLVPGTSDEWSSEISSNPALISILVEPSRGVFGGETEQEKSIKKITELYSSEYLTDTEKEIELQKAFPTITIGQAKTITESVTKAQEAKGKRISQITGDDREDTKAIGETKQSMEQEFMEIASPLIKDINKTFIDNLRSGGQGGLELSLTDISQRGNALHSENTKKARMVAASVASLNTALDSNRSIQGTTLLKITDEDVKKLMESQLETSKWNVEASVNGLDSRVFLKQKLEQEGYTTPLALRDKVIQPLKDIVARMPDGPEKTALTVAVAGSMSIDDGIKAMEITINAMHSDHALKRANALIQGVSLGYSSFQKSASGVIGGVGAQALNAEQDLSYVDFSEDGVSLIKHWTTDLAEIAPELTTAISSFIIGNRLGTLAGKASTSVVNAGNIAKNYIANSIAKVPLFSQISVNTPPAIANTLRYVNNLYLGATRNIPKFADEIIQDQFLNSALQAFVPGVNTSEEYDNAMLGLGLSTVIIAAPAVRRATRDGIENRYGLYGITDDIARRMVSETKVSAAMSALEQKKTSEAINKLKSEELLTNEEAIDRVRTEGLHHLTPEEKNSIIDAATKESVSIEEVEAAKQFHQSSLDRISLLYQTDPTKAENITRKAYVQAKISELYNMPLNYADETAQLAEIIKKFGVNPSDGKQFLLAQQLQRDLNTVLPVRFAGQTSNIYDVSLDAYALNTSLTRGYSIPDDVRLQIGDINFYKPLDDEQFAILEKIGITKESEGLFKQTDKGYVITQDGIKQIGISDPNNTILKSQIPLSKEDEIIMDIVKNTLGEETAQRVTNTNAIENIYNSIKTLC